MCGGLGRQLGLDPLLFRILAAVLCFAGGAGVLLYALAWLLVPEDGAAESEGEKLAHGRGDAGSAAVVVVVLLGFALSGGFFLGRPGSTFAALVIVLVIGAVMLARRQPVSTAAYSPAAGPSPSPPAYTFGPSPAYSTTGYPPADPTLPYGPPPAPPYGPLYGPGTGTAYAPPQPPTSVYGPPPPPEPRERSFLGLVVLSLGLLTGAALIAADLSGASVGPRVVLASIVLVVGLGMILGSFVGRSLWLIIFAIPLSVALGVVSAVEPTIGAGTGSPVWTPFGTPVARVLQYRLGAGDATLDLSQLQTTAGLRINAKVGAGHLVVRVPDGLSVRVTAHSRAGEVDIPGSYSSGLSVDRTWVQGGEPQVVVDADVVFGKVEVLDAQA